MAPSGRVQQRDVTCFSRCGAAPNCFAVIDLVSRKWISTLLSPEETATQTQAVFLDALEAENLIGLIEGRLDTGELPDADQIPILLAVSDNGAPMTADAKAFMALCSIAQHFGHPNTLTDQAPIESFSGHIKGEWPHLEAISDPQILCAELERVQIESRYAGDPPRGRGGLRRWVRWRSVHRWTGSRTVLAAS